MTEKPASKADRGELSRFVGPLRRELGLPSALVVLANLIWLPQAALVSLAISGLVTPGAPVELVQMVAGFALLGILRALLVYVAEGRIFRVSERATAQLRREIIDAEKLRSRESAPGSAVVAALVGEKLDMIEPYLLRYAPARLRVVTVPLAILAAAFWFSWAVGLIFLITGPLIPVFMALVGMAARQASERQMERIGTLNDLLSERLAALADIRILDATGAVVSGFRDEADTLRARAMEVLRIAFLSSTVLELFAAIGVAMVAVYVGFNLLGELRFGTYSGPLSPFAGLFVLLLAPEFYQPLRDLAAAWHDKAAAEAVMGDVETWRHSPRGTILGSGMAAPGLPGPPDIETRGLGYLMPEGHILRFPDLDIAAGGTVALTGASGAGKTVLLSLLAGLRSPSRGTVRVAGRNLSPDTADGWRARLGWIPQQPRFLNASLRRNIAMSGAPDPDRLRAAMRAASVEDVVASAPRGLETRLGETGSGLSGGEARRIAIARAHYAGADVILADEPTADLDAETAAAVTRGLLTLAEQGATLIVATHDPELAARMDRVVRIGERA